jgi:hypothetical protein
MGDNTVRAHGGRSRSPPPRGTGALATRAPRVPRGAGPEAQAWYGASHGPEPRLGRGRRPPTQGGPRACGRTATGPPPRRRPMCIATDTRARGGWSAPPRAGVPGRRCWDPGVGRPSHPRPARPLQPAPQRSTARRAIGGPAPMPTSVAATTRDDRRRHDPWRADARPVRCW